MGLSLGMKLEGFKPPKEENEEGEYVANVDVEEEDRGIAIGKGGKNIFKANKLAERQHDIVNVQIITDENL